MSVRWPFVYASALMALGSGGIAAAEDLRPEQARTFVVDKLFDYTCFDGTAGMVRIFSDGSVVGTIRSGQGETRFTALPEGTIRVDEQIHVRVPGEFAVRDLFPGGKIRLPQLSRFDCRFEFCLLRLLPAQSPQR